MAALFLARAADPDCSFSNTFVTALETIKSLAAGLSIPGAQ
jgi:hypothetical protein